ncbi:MAG: N-acetylmuramoyl-L-alanine amidase family protein [Pseudobdellovibrio sp.]
MKRFARIFVMLFLNFHFCSAAENYSLRVVLDPGHGGHDLGATRDSFVESKIVLEISKKVKKRLEELNITDVHLTRESDQTLSLQDRVSFANKIGADIYVSLHANTSISPSLSGMEFYFSNFKPDSQTMSAAPEEMTNNEVVAQVVKDFNSYAKIENSLSLSKAFQVNNQSTKSIIKQAPFYVLENTQMPSVLIELGFISNRREAKNLTNPEYQNAVADSIAEAVLEFKKSLRKE